MPQINPKKLHHSKWTAVSPQKKELHFLVTKVVFDENDQVEECILQAIMSKNEYSINWHDLKSSEQWIQGWK